MELSRNRTSTRRSSCPTLTPPLTPRGRLRLARCVVERRLAAAPGRRAVPGLGDHGRAVGRPVPRARARPGWSTGPRGRTARRAAPRPRRERRIVKAAGDPPLGAGPDRATAWGCTPRRCTRCCPATAGPAGLARTGPPARSVVRRYEHAAPGDLVHVDIKKLGRIPDGGGWRGCTVAAAQPAGPAPRPGLRVHPQRRRRPLPAGLLRDPRRRAQGDRRGVLDPRARLLRRPRHHRDAGADRQRLLLPLQRLRRGPRATITHKRTRPYRPQTNGKVERFNRTLLEEWAYARPYAHEAERAAALPDWLHPYNHHRGHTALGGQPPASRVTNLSGQYT